MTPATQFHFEWTLFNLYDADPSLTIKEYVLRLREAGVFWLTMGAGSKRVERLLKKWNITRKKASVTSPLKYRTEFIVQRFDYLDWVTRQCLADIFFLDESTFENWDLRRRQARSRSG
jgi:hypothetical protein